MPYLKIDGTDNTPEINFDCKIGEFWISGNSYFNNSIEFYINIVNWMNENADQCKQRAKIHIFLHYFDSSSKKGIVELIKLFAKHSKKNMEVNWHHKTDDPDMLELGNEFARYFKDFDFNFITD
jgi:hypothetical protein